MEIRYEEAKVIQHKIKEICDHIEDFCNKRGDQELSNISKEMCLDLGDLEPSPLVNGDSKEWACGIVHAIGMMNELFQPDSEEYIAENEFYQVFGVSPEAGKAKSKLALATLDLEDEVIGAGEEVLDDWIDQWVASQEDELRLEMYQELTEEEQNKLEDAHQYLTEQLFNMVDDDETQAIAKKAIELSPYCITAYGILIDSTNSLDEKIHWAKTSIEKQEITLGHDNLTTMHGELSTWVETEEYLETMMELALLYKKNNQLNEALEQMEKLLALDENDPQEGMDYYIHWLIEAGKFDEAKELLDEHKRDHMANKAFAQVLLFVAQDKMKQAELALANATILNGQIISQLTGEIKMNAESFNAMIDEDEEDEAIEYFVRFADSWNAVGGVQWLLEWKKAAPPKVEQAPAQKNLFPHKGKKQQFQPLKK